MKWSYISPDEAKELPVPKGFISIASFLRIGLGLSLILSAVFHLIFVQQLL